MVDPYAIMKRLTGCDLISPKDGKQLIEAVDGLIDEIKGKDALIQSLSSQLAEAMEYGGQARLRENAAEDARIHEQFRASKAEADRDRLAADLERLKADLKAQIRRATDAEYMSVAYRNMLGPIGIKVVEMWDERGVKRVHFDWETQAFEMGGEDRAQLILDWESAPRREIDAASLEDWA